MTEWRTGRYCPGITVCIPSIPPRWGGAGYLKRLLNSIVDQTLIPAALALVVDGNHEGSYMIRNRLLNMVQTDLLTMMDDDDWAYPEHLAALYRGLVETDADFVYSYFDSNMADPLGLFGQPFDPATPDTTSVVLVRTELAQQIRYSPPQRCERHRATGPQGWHPDCVPPGCDLVGGEDRRFALACYEAGAKIVHLPQRTWHFTYHGYEQHPNTSGQPANW
jgi:hypothetical protein